MAVREYIGARYVPRFMGLYNATQIYDALDVVDNGSGTSYIAKKTVPAGTPLTNTAYWFVYGASSGAIIQLQNDVSDLYARKEDPISERTFLFLGDSYDTVTTDHWSDMTADYIKCKAHIRCSKGGANFIRPDAPYSGYTYINNMGVLTTAQLESVTDVVIGASVNDNGSNQDLINAIDATDYFLRTSCPNLKNIYLMAIGWDVGDATRQDRVRNNVRIYSQHAPTIGWRYYDCTRVMKLGAYTDPLDGYHPLQAACDHIAECVAQCILSGCCTWFSAQEQVPFTYSLPSQLQSGTVYSPANLEDYLRVRALPDGTIAWTFNSELTLQSITGPLSFAGIDIGLTFDEPKLNPIPFYYNQNLNGLINGTSGAGSSWPMWLNRQGSGNTRLRIVAKCPDSDYTLRCITMGSFNFEMF